MAKGRVLYWGSGSPPCWRAMIALEEKGLDYDSKLLTFSKGEHKSDEVLALNPRGQLPTFKDGDAVVNESLGLVMYLETQYPEKPLLPADAATKARVLQRVAEVTALEGKVRPYLLKKFRGEEDPNEEQHIKDLKEELERWEAIAGKFTYLAADTFTLADVVVGPSFRSLHRFGLTFENHPNLKKYHDAIKDYPSVAKTEPPHWKEEPPKMDAMKIF